MYNIITLCCSSVSEAFSQLDPVFQPLTLRIIPGTKTCMNILILIARLDYLIVIGPQLYFDVKHCELIQFDMY